MKGIKTKHITIEPINEDQFSVTVTVKTNKKIFSMFLKKKRPQFKQMAKMIHPRFKYLIENAISKEMYDKNETFRDFVSSLPDPYKPLDKQHNTMIQDNHGNQDTENRL